MAKRAPILRSEGRADAAVLLAREGLLDVVSPQQLLELLDLGAEDIRAAVRRQVGEPVPCELIGCHDPLYARGQCRRHYLAAWRRESDAPWARPTKAIRDAVVAGKRQLT